jgi:hypothetical protein
MKAGKEPSLEEGKNALRGLAKDMAKAGIPADIARAHIRGAAERGAREAGYAPNGVYDIFGQVTAAINEVVEHAMLGYKAAPPAAPPGAPVAAPPGPKDADPFGKDKDEPTAAPPVDITVPGLPPMTVPPANPTPHFVGRPGGITEIDVPPPIDPPSVEVDAPAGRDAAPAAPGKDGVPTALGAPVATPDKVTTTADGNTITEKADGTKIVQDRDGNALIQMPDGRLYFVSPDGNTHRLR